MNLDGVTEIIIGCAINVHKQLAPGLLESLYEAAMVVELGKTGLKYDSQKEIDVKYDGVSIGKQRLDLLVEGAIVVEPKSVERVDPVFQAQLLSYMKMGGFPVGFLINFNTRLLKHGVKRMVFEYDS